MQESDELLRRLIYGGVEFVVVGDLAAMAHGVRGLNQGLDIVAAFTPENMQRLLAALHDVRPCNAVSREFPAIHASAEELASWRNIYLVTDLGRLDVLGELPLIGGYAEAVVHAVWIEIFGGVCAILGLDDLIRIERSASRKNDQRVAAELEMIRERLRG